MNYLMVPISKNLFRQKSAMLLLGITLFPLLIIAASFVNTNFMQLEGAEGSISGLGFISAILSTQHQFIFPFIILAYIAATTFYDEIKSGRLIIFKDAPKNSLLTTKRASVFALFALYFLLMCLTTTITYFAYINRLPIAAHTFLPASHKETQQLIVEVLGFFLTELIGLSVALTVSTILPSGYTILVTIFYQLLSMLAPGLASLRYFFPTGYKTLLGSMSFGVIIAVMFAVTAVCLFVSKMIAVKLFKQVEY